MDLVVTVTQAARILGLTTGRVRQLLLAGELTGNKTSGNGPWLLERAAVEEYARRHPQIPGTAGRPRKAHPQLA